MSIPSLQPGVEERGEVRIKLQGSPGDSGVGRPGHLGITEICGEVRGSLPWTASYPEVSGAFLPSESRTLNKKSKPTALVIPKSIQSPNMFFTGDCQMAVVLAEACAAELAYCHLLLTRAGLAGQAIFAAPFWLRMLHPPRFSAGGWVYSYLKLSTGSNCAARAAGTVPKTTPTIDETNIAIIAESPEIGMRYSVKKRTE